MTDTQFLERDGKPRLAYCYTAPENKDLPTVVFLGGYISDMQGTKAVHLEARCTSRGQGFLRLDYSGHGESDGAFEDGTLGQWINDARDIIKHTTGSDDLILIGSSMGGWIALNIAVNAGFNINGIIGIAPAPDFTKWGIEDTITDEQSAQLSKEGRIKIGRGIYTKGLITDATNHLVLDKTQSIDIPIAIFHGKKDDVVPWELAFKIKAAFPNANAQIVLIDDGDHRLSRESDLHLIDRKIKFMSGI